ncbi:dTMP kinase [Streptomyces brevispora]|uniref:dTMP kinase n=1 Tax=Streptomyces brevispora TaxID=887462 RepID=UPI003722EF71
MMQRGQFITLDGPSGVGKSTTLEALSDVLTRRRVPVRRTLEPSTTDTGRFVSENFAHIRGHALACLVAADRYQHVEHEIRPWLDAGDTVVCDRYLASTLVMQRLDGVPLKFLLDLNAAVLRPDLSVILTADPTLIASRIAERGPRNRFHRDPTAPGREVALYAETAGLLKTAGVGNVLVVNTGTATPTEVASLIADAALKTPVASAASPSPSASQGP